MWDPYWKLQADFPPGDKTFSSFQNGKKPSVKLKPPVPFPTPIKWKEYQLDPLGAAFAASLRGINSTQVALKKILIPENGQKSSWKKQNKSKNQKKNKQK